MSATDDLLLADPTLEGRIDALARALYDARARNPQPMSDASWARKKTLFPGSVRIAREDAAQMILDGEDE